MKKKWKSVKWFYAVLLTALLAVGLPLAGQTDWMPFSAVSVSAANIQISTRKVTLFNGGKTTLSLNGVKKNVEWSSSNKSVVQVNSKGVVQAKKKGTATVTATYNKKKYTCSVTVKQQVTGLKLNKTTLELAKPTATADLKVTVLPASASSKAVTWKSSNTSVARVDSKGKVTATGKGSCTITVTSSLNKDKKAVCKVTVKDAKPQPSVVTPNPDGATYKVHGGKVTVTGKGWSRTYTNYSQMTREEFYPKYGCVVTAVATAASGYGSKYSQKAIHTGAASKKYSERYAVKRLGQSVALYGRAAIALPTASQILTDLGIRNKPVYTFNEDQAIAEITENLMAGRPVIVHANNRRHNGIRIANSHHGVVLVGIDKDGYAIMLEPVGGRVNYAHGCGKKCRLTVEDIVRYHINQTAKSKLGAAYVTNSSAFGGYILLQ